MPKFFAPQTDNFITGGKVYRRGEAFELTVEEAWHMAVNGIYLTPVDGEDILAGAQPIPVTVMQTADLGVETSRELLRAGMPYKDVAALNVIEPLPKESQERYAEMLGSTHAEERTAAKSKKTEAKNSAPPANPPEAATAKA